MSSVVHCVYRGGGGAGVARATNSSEDALSNLALIDILSTSNLSSDRQLVDDGDRRPSRRSE